MPKPRPFGFRRSNERLRPAPTPKSEVKVEPLAPKPLPQADPWTVRPQFELPMLETRGRKKEKLPKEHKRRNGRLFHVSDIEDAFLKKHLKGVNLSEFYRKAVFHALGVPGPLSDADFRDQTPWDQTPQETGAPTL